MWGGIYTLRLPTLPVESCAAAMGGNYEALERTAISSISGILKGDVSNAARTLASSIGVEHSEASEFIQAVTDR